MSPSQNVPKPKRPQVKTSPSQNVSKLKRPLVYSQSVVPVSVKAATIEFYRKIILWSKRIGLLKLLSLYTYGKGGVLCKKRQIPVICIRHDWGGDKNFTVQANSY